MDCLLLLIVMKSIGVVIRIVILLFIHVLEGECVRKWECGDENVGGTSEYFLL